MSKLRTASFVLCLCFIASHCSAQDAAPALLLAKGVIEKAEKDSLTILPRESSGRFGKTLTLKLTGTSKISTLTTEKRAGKPVHVQRDTNAKDLQVKQGIAIIYTTGPAGPVLLAAVVQPESEK
ncbi:MAG TPA: hypothetical protein VKU02_23195 [Gemmataceae bacterium]|nr:hypothetical protein [Gemmataceae bacterium]